MKILVTGGAGFIGSHIADAYLKAGHQVVIIDNLSSGKKEYIPPQAGFYQADITDKKEVEKIIAKEKPEIINHHAAQMSVRKSVEDPANDANINILGILHLLEAGRSNGLKKCIFASSGGVVYGDAATIPTSEDYVPLLPLSPYGVSKLASEHYLYFYFKTYGIQYVALRYGNVFGPRQNPHGEAGVVAIFAKKLLSHERPVINGDGLQTRDYVFVGDVVRANVSALDTDVTGSFNIGTGQETSVVEIFNKLKEITASTLEPNHGPAAPGEQKRSCLDIRRSYEILGWEPKTTLALGLKQTAEYFS